jgi:hypothetical protein
MTLPDTREDILSLAAARHALAKSLRDQSAMVARGWTVHADASLLSKAATEIERLGPYEDELRKIADDLGEPDDPFAAWESIEALKAAPTPPAAEAPGQEPVAVPRWAVDLAATLISAYAPDERNLLAALSAPPTYADAEAEGFDPRPLDEWHEDYGPAVWWSIDPETGDWRGEAAFIGSPIGSDWPEDYYTHWTPHPAFPSAPAIRSLASPAPKEPGQ